MADNAPTLDRISLLWACGAVAASVLPLIFVLGFKVATLALLPLAVQALRLTLRKTAPLSRVVLTTLALATAVAVVAQFGTIFGKQAGLTLLANLVCLKLLESRNRRDLHVAVQLCFFLQLGYFLEEQSALTAVLAAASCVLCLAALLRVEQAQIRFSVAVRGSGKLLLIALPLTVALFVFFPRIDQPLWGLPSEGTDARTGLSDHMSPGSIAELSLSSEIAFRAEFPGAIPPPLQRYFRGPVLSFFDGRSWKPALDAGLPQQQTTRPALLHYTLTLEAHRQRWLLALEQGVAEPGQILDRDGVLLAQTPINTRQRLRIASRPGGRIAEELPERLKRTLHLPFGFNPRTLALGQKIRREHPQTEDRLAAALTVLRTGDYLYTLTPPLLGRNSVDEFLFDTRRGFCEHFASAFAVLMRAASIPARVVTGYMGGEINPVDRTLVVRQSDAHAWTEVWLEGKGWLRVDPTAIAAPRRIDGGLVAALPSSDALPVIARLDWPLIHSLRNRLEAAGHAWNIWVLGYNVQRQKDLMLDLGLPDADWRILVAGLASSALIWQALVWQLSRQRRTPRTPSQKAWHRLCRHLAKQGFVVSPSEGPLDFAVRVGKAHPEWKTALETFALRYARLRFGPPDADQGSPQQLDQAIREWISTSRYSAR